MLPVITSSWWENPSSCTSEGTAGIWAELSTPTTASKNWSSHTKSLIYDWPCKPLYRSHGHLNLGAGRAGRRRLGLNQKYSFTAALKSPTYTRVSETQFRNKYSSHSWVSHVTEFIFSFLKNKNFSVTCPTRTNLFIWEGSCSAVDRNRRHCTCLLVLASLGRILKCSVSQRWRMVTTP